jgi:tripartite-type tricarboxylate transporter receptor subunit TctC
MKLPHRRHILHLTAGAAALPALTRIARAQAYPSRPVRIVVGFPAGGTQDIIARLIGQWLSERLGQQFVVENRAGAGGNVGAEAVARATADGYTLLLVGQPNAVNATLYDKLNFNFINDVAPVASIIRVSQVIVVNPSVPAKTVPEFVAYAKANAGRIAMASSGGGTPPHIAGELFKMAAGVDLLHVPYRGGGPALIDLLGGQVQVYFGSMPETIQYIRAGTLRALAVTTVTRSEAVPDLPVAADFVPGYEASSWYGVGAPKSTPAEIVEQLNKEINAALTDPRMKAKLAELGGTVLPGSASDFGKLIVGETEKWGKVIRAANIKP